MTDDESLPAPVDRGGRPASTSPHELAEAAQRLFLAQGFERTSVDDITTAVGVSRRTFFRYFRTKADVLWVETGAETRRLRDQLAAAPADEPYKSALSRAVLAALHLPAEQRDWALHRAQLVLNMPAVQAQAALRFNEWRSISAAFAAERVGLPDDELFPIAVGHAVTAASLAAHERWISHPEAELAELLGQALELLLPAEPGDW
jgi:mycofactocin system transcriptional regulator